MEEDEVEEIPPPGGGPRSWGDPAMVAMAESETDGGNLDIHRFFTVLFVQ